MSSSDRAAGGGNCRLNGCSRCSTAWCMTEIMTIRLPRQLAADLKSKAQAAKTTPSAVLRQMAADYVKSGKKPARNALQEHILAHAGRWDGYCSGEELLCKTRP